MQLQLWKEIRTTRRERELETYLKFYTDLYERYLRMQAQNMVRQLRVCDRNEYKKWYQRVMDNLYRHTNSTNNQAQRLINREVNKTKRENLRHIKEIFRWMSHNDLANADEYRLHENRLDDLLRDDKSGFEEVDSPAKPQSFINNGIVETDMESEVDEIDPQPQPSTSRAPTWEPRPTDSRTSRLIRPDLKTQMKRKRPVIDSDSETGEILYDTNDVVSKKLREIRNDISNREREIVEISDDDDDCMIVEDSFSYSNLCREGLSTDSDQTEDEESEIMSQKQCEKLKDRIIRTWEDQEYDSEAHRKLLRIEISKDDTRSVTADTELYKNRPKRKLYQGLENLILAVEGPEDGTSMKDLEDQDNSDMTIEYSRTIENETPLRNSLEDMELHEHYYDYNSSEDDLKITSPIYEDERSYVHWSYLKANGESEIFEAENIVIGYFPRKTGDRRRRYLMFPNIMSNRDRPVTRPANESTRIELLKGLFSHATKMNMVEQTYPNSIQKRINEICVSHEITLDMVQSLDLTGPRQISQWIDDSILDQANEKLYARTGDIDEFLGIPTEDDTWLIDDYSTQLPYLVSRKPVRKTHPLWSYPLCSKVVYHGNLELAVHSSSRYVHPSILEVEPEWLRAKRVESYVKNKKDFLSIFGSTDISGVELENDREESKWWLD